MNQFANGDGAALCAVLSHAARSVPFYMDHGCRDGQPLERYPVTTKAMIRADPGAFLSDAFAEVASGLGGELAMFRGPGAVSFNKQIMVEETSGSSGTPLRCPKTVSERLILGSAAWVQRRAVDPEVTPEGLWLGERRPAEGPNPWDLSTDNLVALYDGVARQGYRWAHGFPALLLEHVEVLDRAGYNFAAPSLRYVECAGAYLRPEVADRLQAFFRTPVLDQYGLTEIWVVALSCPHGGRHLNQATVAVEILDDDNRPLPAGRTGRICLSSLKLRLMPFIRYLTGDTGRIETEPCPCGRPGPILSLLEGRPNEFIAGRPERLLGTRLFVRVAGEAAEVVGAHEIVNFLRVVQTAPRRFVVRTNAFEALPRYREAFAAAAQSELGPGVEWTFQVAAEAEIAAEGAKKPWLFRSECANEPRRGRHDPS